MPASQRDLLKPQTTRSQPQAASSADEVTPHQVALDGRIPGRGLLQSMRDACWYIRLDCLPLFPLATGDACNG